MCLLQFSPFLYYINKSLPIKIWFSQRQVLYNVSIFRSNCGNIFIRKWCWGLSPEHVDLKGHRQGEQRSIPLCISYSLIMMNSCTKKMTEKRKIKNTVFILKYIWCSLENVLYLFFLQSFTDNFWKSIYYVMAAFAYLLQVLLDFALVCYVVKSWLWHKRFYKYFPAWKISFCFSSLLLSAFFLSPVSLFFLPFFLQIKKCAWSSILPCPSRRSFGTVRM